MNDFKFIALKLGIACIITFLLQLLIPPLTSIFILDSSIVAYEPWRIFTHVFIHADLRHLFNNMFALILFGSVAERLAGSKRFLQLLFSALIISSLFSIAFYDRVLGASGLIYAAIGYAAIKRPGMVVPAFGIPMYISAAALLWILLDVAGIFYPSNIAHLSHISGFIIGLAFGFYDKEWRIKERGEKNKEGQDIISDEEIEEWEEQYMRN